MDRRDYSRSHSQTNLGNIFPRGSHLSVNGDRVLIPEEHILGLGNLDEDDELFIHRSKLLEEHGVPSEKTEESQETCIPFYVIREVCPTCGGKGTHVNPSIDAHGITAEEWDRDWSHEDRENYMSGMYDVTCYECNGNNVVLVIDETRANAELLKLFNDYCNEERNYRNTCDREQAMERGFGA